MTSRRGRSRHICDLATHDERFISIEQFARYVGVSYRTVKNAWIGKGALPAYDFEGVLRIETVDARAFVVKNRLPTATKAASSDIT